MADKPCGSLSLRDNLLGFVSGYAVTIQGYAIPTLWVNGKAQYLAPESADISANSVYVVEKANSNSR